jgi:antitoxin component YwqK of YwqJK toxin-antitoxin module
METLVQKTYYDSGKIKTMTDVVNGEKHGKHVLYAENGQLLVESFYVDDKSHGKWTEYYENGQLAEEGEYVNGEYHVYNFWTENGDQLLKKGTGKTIRKFGHTQSEIYEQYFENGRFTGERKIQGVIYGKFTPN